MKPRCSNQRSQALTLVELLVVIVVLVILAVVLLPTNHGNAKKVAMRIACANNLKQIGIAYLIRGGDSEPDLHLHVSVTNGGVMELVESGNALASYVAMTNEITSSKILVCPADTGRFFSTNFPKQFNRQNLSYFVGIDAKDAVPQALLSGDDNLQIGGVPVKSGRLEFSTNEPIGWTAVRHNLVGNIGLADGSVQLVSSNTLHTWLLPSTGLTTNRLVIP